MSADGNDWCRHYTGLLGPGAVRIEQCKAGVVYREGDRRTARVLGVLPCVGKAPSANCLSYSPYTAEERAEQGREIAAYIRRVFDERECPRCKQTYQGKQVGPCCYCEGCGNRLYQGSVK